MPRCRAPPSPTFAERLCALVNDPFPDTAGFARRR